MTALVLMPQGLHFSGLQHLWPETRTDLGKLGAFTCIAYKDSSVPLDVESTGYRRLEFPLFLGRKRGAFEEVGGQEKRNL